jgi:hypothetical protein
MKTADPDLTITESSDNVFADLGFNDAEATILAFLKHVFPTWCVVSLINLVWLH